MALDLLGVALGDRLSSRLRPGRWCNFPGFERRIVDVESHRGIVSE